MEKLLDFLAKVEAGYGHERGYGYGEGELVHYQFSALLGEP